MTSIKLCRVEVFPHYTKQSKSLKPSKSNQNTFVFFTSLILRLMLFLFLFLQSFFRVIRINLLVKHQKLNWANEYVIKCLCIQHSVSTDSAKSFKLVANKTKQKTSNYFSVHLLVRGSLLGFFFVSFFIRLKWMTLAPFGCCHAAEWSCYCYLPCTRFSAKVNWCIWYRLICAAVHMSRWNHVN